MYIWYPGQNLENQTLREVLATMTQDQEPDSQESIPWSVRAVENPEHWMYQLLRLPGGSKLERHDPLHAVLEMSTTIEGEAFTLGFSMGADTLAQNWQLKFYVWWVSHITPHPFVFDQKAILAFWLGVGAAKRMGVKDIHRVALEEMHNQRMDVIRRETGIDINYLRRLYGSEWEVLWSAHSPQASANRYSGLTQEGNNP